MRDSRDLDASIKDRNLDWYQQDVVDVIRRLNSTDSGLTAAEAARRLKLYGANEIDLQKNTSPFNIFVRQFRDFMILLLLAAAVVSGVVGEFKDTLVIAGVLVLNAAIGFAQEYRAERAMEALRTLAARQATVVRDNDTSTVPASELVPGDIVILEAGMVIPADVRLAESFTLRVEEASLTGESGHVDKLTQQIPDDALPLGDRSNMAYSGTTVTHGRGRGIVVATGLQTEFGKIAAMLQRMESGRTPLQRRLEHFGKRLSFTALTISALVLILGVMRGEPLLLMAMTAITLAVAAIPEALPAVVTISLALGARRMVQRKALIRKLPAVETLGSVTVICSDKTGTLTMNRMKVEQLYCDGALTETPRTDGRWEELLRAMAISNDVQRRQDGSHVGDSTELAMVAAAAETGVSKAENIAKYPRVAEAPFDSGRKLMTTVHALPSGGFVSYTKGAAEVVLARLAELQDEAAIARVADQMANDGRRVIACAMRGWTSLPNVEPTDAVEASLTFLGLVAIGDPARPEAREAVRMCRSAGIVPVMITGDHPATARAIARQLEITQENDSVLTGRDLSALSSEEIRGKVVETRVYARVAPEQKYQIVAALQGRGHVVAMTGDGVNDAPALKRADIGIAMGLTGTDVTKESSSMILLDDNFATIVSAVREGRVIYDNLRRFIRYALTTNASEVWIMFVASLAGLPIPLLPVQILWINLITDGLPGLTLAAEPAEPDVMERPPRPPQESVFAHGLGIHVVWVSVLMAALALAVHWQMVEAASESPQTMVLTVVGFSQLAHVLAIRSERQSLFSQGLLSNAPLFGAVALTTVLQICVIYVPFMNDWFQTVPLSGQELAVAVALSSLVFFAVEAEKWLVRRGWVRYRT